MSEVDFQQLLPRATAALKRHKRVFDEVLSEVGEVQIDGRQAEDLCLLIYATGDEESRRAMTEYLGSGTDPFEGMSEEEIKSYDRKLAQQIVLAAD